MTAADLSSEWNITKRSVEVAQSRAHNWLLFSLCALGGPVS